MFPLILSLQLLLVVTLAGTFSRTESTFLSPHLYQQVVDLGLQFYWVVHSRDQQSSKWEKHKLHQTVADQSSSAVRKDVLSWQDSNDFRLTSESQLYSQEWCLYHKNKLVFSKEEVPTDSFPFDTMTIDIQIGLKNNTICEAFESILIKFHQMLNHLNRENKQLKLDLTNGIPDEAGSSERLQNQQRLMTTANDVVVPSDNSLSLNSTSTQTDYSAPQSHEPVNVSRRVQYSTTGVPTGSPLNTGTLPTHVSETTHLPSGRLVARTPVPSSLDNDSFNISTSNGTSTAVQSSEDSSFFARLPTKIKIATIAGGCLILIIATCCVMYCVVLGPRRKAKGDQSKKDSKAETTEANIADHIIDKNIADNFVIPEGIWDPEPFNKMVKNSAQVNDVMLDDILDEMQTNGGPDASASRANHRRKRQLINNKL